MREAFAKALRTARKAHGFTQEDFSEVSSRTYVSILERGQKSPTLNKMNDIANTLGVHLLTLVTLAHVQKKNVQELDALLEQVRKEVVHIFDNAETFEQEKDVQASIDARKKRSPLIGEEAS
ncbi:MAG: helix-turn-helix domain-containing protein [Pseudomonadota bacterium]